MFDDIKEPEDIFAGIDPVAASNPSGGAAKPTSAETSVVRSGPSPLIPILIAAIALGAAAGGYYWWSMRGELPENGSPTPADTAGDAETDSTTDGTAEGNGTPDTEEPSDEEVLADIGANTPATGEEDLPVPEDPADLVEPELTIDSDNDGLSDSEETEAGTDPYLTDTDSDGLSDFDEIRIYGTDPLNPDTDGDGYSDGQEVAGNYNPNGPGRLFEIPE